MVEVVTSSTCEKGLVIERFQRYACLRVALFGKLRYVQRNTYGNVRYIQHKQRTRKIDVTMIKLAFLMALDDDCVDFTFFFAGSNWIELVATTIAA